jgi:hypothetical protein
MKKLLLGLGIFLLLLAAASWFFATSIAENRARAYLAARDVPVASLTVRSLWFDAITLSDVALGQARNVTAASLTLSRTGDIAYPYAIEAEDLKINGRAQGGLMDLGGVEKLWQRDPFPADASTSLAFTVKGDAELELSDKGALRGLVAIAKATADQGEHQLTLVNLVMEPTTSPGPIYHVPFTLDTLTIASVGAPLIAPLAARGEAQFSAPEGKANVTAALADARQHFTATLAGHYALASGEGEVTLATPTLTLGNGALELASFLPTHAADLATPPMKLGLNARLILAQGGWETLSLNAAFSEAPVAAILEQALGKNARLEGQVEGSMPLTITRTGWQLDQARIRNQGPMRLSLLGGRAAALTSILGKAGTDARALQEINVSSLDAVASTVDANGTMQLTGRVVGHNPLLNRPVALNLNVTTNLKDLLRSMIGPVVNTHGAS